MAMQDSGFNQATLQATLAAGGVNGQARKIGVSEPSLPNSNRVPAGRAVLVEGVLAGGDGAVQSGLRGVRLVGEIDEVDAARAQEYALLSVVLRHAPNADMLNRLATLRGDTSPLGIAHAALGEAAAAANVEFVEREFFNLFIGVGRGELLPYGSYYLTGFLNERPLARLRDDLARFGIERVEGEVEPEDHAAMLCEIMAGLAGGRFDAPAGADRELFEKHLLPWIGRFFADLERAEAADLYRRIGALGRVLVEIESEAFALTS
jgi:TorA maturation chaperone TorD